MKTAKRTERWIQDATTFLDAARRLLDGVDFDGERRNVLLLAPLVEDRTPWREAVVQLDRALEIRASAEALALKGKALTLFGEHEDAAAAFKSSLELEPENARALVWGAELSLLAGRPADARAALDRAVAHEPAYAWGHFYSAACFLALNDPKRASDALAPALAASPKSAAFHVLQALALARAGAPADGLRWWGKPEAPRAGWALAFRAMLRAETGDRAGAEADLAAALETEPLPWIRVLRSQVREKAGYIAEAVADMDAVLGKEPAHAPHWARRAHLQFCRRKHPEALADLDEAVRLSPTEAEWLLRRADIRFLLGELEPAEVDLAAASALEPGRPDLAERLAHVRTLLGRAPKAGFWAGYAALRDRDWKKAANEFGKGKDDRHRFYRLIAEQMKGPPPGPGERPPAPKGAGKLLIASLGLNPPYSISVEVARALTGCDVAFNNVAGPETAELLWSLTPRVLPATYDGMNDEHPWADRIFAELDAGRTVAFATRGHAQVLGGLAWELLERCRKQGVSVRALAGLSSLDVLAAAAFGLLSGDGLQAFDAAALEQGAAFDAKAPLLLYFYAGADDQRLRRTRGRLLLEYPASHEVLVFGPKYDTPPVKRSLGSLGEAGESFHASLVLAVPPL